MAFKPNRKFKRTYKKLFNTDPLQANLFLLMAEMADENGQMIVKNDEELAELMAARFNDPREWGL